MDKENLKKHHFWILLALAVVLIPVVIGGTVFGVGAAAANKKNEIDTKLKAVQSQQAKSNQYLAKQDEYKAELTKQRDKVWKEVYEKQCIGDVPFIHWPDRLADLNSKYFGDPLPVEMKSVYRINAYPPEYTRLPELIKPTEFVDRDWRRVLQHVNWRTDPTDEECWLSLETLCVQREILRDIQEVNRMLSKFLPMPNPDATPPTDPAERKLFDAEVVHEKALAEDAKKRLAVKDGEAFGMFKSPYWSIALVAERPRSSRDRDRAREGEIQFRGEITNISGRRQNLARVDFKVWFTDRKKDPNAPAVVLPIQHEYLPADDGTGKNNVFKFDNLRVPGALRGPAITGVEQVLDLRFAPVKRVDKLVLGYPSHRHGDRTLVPANGPAFEEAKKAAEAAAAAAPAGPMGGFRAGDGGAPGTGGGSVDATPNGIPRKRYLGLSEQVRWMPIAVTLIVDQTHIQDITRAFANSRLRFQGTQMHWQRFRGQLGFDLDPATGTTTPGDASAGPGPGVGGGRTEGPPRPGRGAGVGARGGEMSGSPGGGTGQPAGPGRFGGGSGGQPAPTADPDEGPVNLVEVTIYGIASLYEKFPPKPKGDAAAAPPAPTDPGTASPPAPPAVPAAPAGNAPAAPALPEPKGPAPQAPPPPPVPPAPPPGPPGNP